ncbi:MAG TPA: hypothetical protein VN541_02000 [Tepidisphaeraceae bacterium]|nr:hypothetical protein [Tepidisphaeraceae bacterium]
MRRTFCTLITSLMLVAALCPAVVAEDQRDNIRRTRQELLARQRQHYEQSLHGLPLLNEHRMIRIMQLRVENGRLVLQTALNPWPNFMGQRAMIDGLDCPAVVTYTQYIANNPRARQFEFTLEDYPNPETYGRLHLLWRPGWPGAGELSIEKTEQTADGFIRVFFSQSAEEVRLITFGNDGAAGQNATHTQNLVEKDFAALRRKHPSETDQWLRPIFRRLQQDAAFAPDPNAAWQVLVNDWPLNPGVQKTVEQLLADLNSDHSKVRNQASNKLAALGRDGATAIVRLDRRGLTIEQNARLDEVVSRFSPLAPPDVSRLRNNPEFLLDCQFCNDLTVRRLAAARVGQILGHPLNLDPSASDAVRDEMIERMRRLTEGEAHSQSASQ